MTDSTQTERKGSAQERPSLPELPHGATVDLHGHEYEVTGTDYKQDGRVLQYNLTRLDKDGPTANLMPLHSEGEWGVSKHFQLEPDEIEVIEGADDDG